MDDLRAAAKRVGLAALVAAGFGMAVAVAGEGDKFSAVAWTLFAAFAGFNLYLGFRQ